MHIVGQYVRIVGDYAHVGHLRDQDNHQGQHHGDYDGEVELVVVRVGRLHQALAFQYLRERV